MKIESNHHDDTRPNIPTDQLSDMVAELEVAPKPKLYPRDTSLDPQLVWKGKDEQDSEPLEVPTVPIYIQEEIRPDDIIEAVRYDAERVKALQEGRTVRDQPALFSTDDFLPLEKKIEYCQHDEPWRNRMILGDSLLVMNSLAENERFKGQVQTIILDPPYGIKFGSNWQASTRNRNVKDGNETDVTREPEVVKAFRDTWELGIHSYLNYWRDRLTLSKALLAETGSVFVQIGDDNLHYVRNILDEVFGRENFVAIIPFRKKTMPFGANFCEQMADFLVWYAKRKNDENGRPFAKYRPLYRMTLEEPDATYRFFEGSDGLRQEARSFSHLPLNARLYRQKSLEPSGPMAEGMFKPLFQGVEFDFPKNGYATAPDNLKRLINADRVVRAGRYLNYVLFLDDKRGANLTAPWSDTAGADDKAYVVQTNTKVFERCILMTSDPGDLVLDPTCGSGTTAYVAEQWGRRWITIDSSRVALALARTRLMAAKFPAYLLADSPEGRKKESDLTGRAQPTTLTTGAVRHGFVYERVPRVTLKSIANNEEIDEIHARWETRLEPVRAGLNTAVSKQWEPWEIPRTAGDDWPDATKQTLAAYWKLWLERKKEIDASIARRAETVYLYDKPFDNRNAVRVCGPFTVESLSPHRIVAPDEDAAERPESETRTTVFNDGEFEQTIRQNMRRAGVQNTKKGERLLFERLDAYAGGAYLHGEGIQKDTGSRVAISIGPQFGTVSPELVREAVKEARKHFDLLVVCGFAFDPLVHEEASDQAEDTVLVKQYGRFTVLLARINQDLMVGGNVLKKTGAGNLFTVFGEPDVDIRKEGVQLVVQVRGLDIYDPTTGLTRANNVDELACWFVDTAYNGEAFIVRHAYFTGAGDPYEKLRKTLRADIDESAWSALYSPVSRPFDAPETGKIAVKVINHYGDEVLRVYDLAKMGLLL